MSGGTVEGGAEQAQPQHLDVLSPEGHDQTAAEAAEQADPGVTGADQGA